MYEEEQAILDHDELLNKHIMYWADKSQETNVSSVTIPIEVKKELTSLSSNATYVKSESSSENYNIVKVLWDKKGNPHTVATLPKTTSRGDITFNKNYVKPKICNIYQEKARTMCVQCQEIFCFPLRTKRKGGVEVDPNDTCFAHHVIQKGNDCIMY